MPHDAAFAVRQLRRSPVFTAAAVLTLALAIGANTAIFQVLDAVVFRTLPVRDPGRLVRVTLLENGKPRYFSYPEFRELAARQESADLIATSDYPLHAAILRGRGPARTVNAVLVTANYFRVLGVSAGAGQVLDVADDRNPVAVISDSFWAREFGRSASAIGQSIGINKASVTVIGIAPPEFTGETPGNNPDMWLPIGLSPQLLASDWRSTPKSWLNLMARLRPGASAADAQRQLERAWQSSFNPSYRVALENAARGLGDFRARLERPVRVLMASVGVLLLIACTNVATLLAGRAAARSEEIAVRLAIGAGRGRVVRLLLAESVVLCLAGGALGLAFAAWGTQALATQAAGIAAVRVAPDWRVFGFSAGITVVATILAGLAPALAAVRPPRAAGTRDSRRWLGRGLMTVQVALSLVLLSTAALTAKSFWNLRHQDFGLRPSGLIAADLPWEFSPAMMARYAALERPLLEKLNALPDVQAAALAGFGPLGGGQHTSPLTTAGGPAISVRLVHVSPRYFETTGIPIVRGRGISEDDRASAPRVSVLSETAVRRLFGGANPIGRLVSQTERFDAAASLEVVGVARDVRFATPREPYSAIVYLANAQFPAPITTALVRTSADPAPAEANIRAAIHAAAPDLAVASVRPATDIFDAQLGNERVLATLAASFAGLALALATVGVYGVVSHATARRTREVGIRVALGARPAQVTALLAREAASVTLASAVLGGAASVATGRAMRSVLFGIEPFGIGLPLLAAAVVAVVALIAAYLPARRAAARDPNEALRQA